jgi:hypothetical protein
VPSTCVSRITVASAVARLAVSLKSTAVQFAARPRRASEIVMPLVPGTGIAKLIEA